MLLVELIVAGVLAGAKLGIPALGFALLFYASKELHFAYGALGILSGYVLFGFLNAVDDPGFASIVVACVVAIVVTTVAHVAVHKLLYRRLGSVLPVVMLSLGLALVIENAIQLFYGPGYKIITVGTLTSVVSFGRVRVRVLELIVFVLFVLIATGIVWFMERTKPGAGLTATIEDAEMAELVGVRTHLVRFAAYAVGGALGGLAGMIMLVDTGVNPGNGFILLLFALIITIVGRGSIRAVAVWSLAFGVIRSVWAWQFSTQLQELAMFTLMMGYLVFRDFASRRQWQRGEPVAPRPGEVRA